MASITNNSQDEPWQERFWKALKDLGFISDFFSWLFALLARLAEPLLMLSTMYVIAETAVPALHSGVVQALAIAIMVTVPEIVLPGSFVIAAKARETGSRLASLLYTMCWAFVVLMLLTIADVLIFHFIGYPLAILMFIRCGVAVGYSILMRVMHHGQSAVLTIAVPDVLALIAALSEQVQSLSGNLHERVSQIEVKNGQVIAATEQQIVSLFGQSLQRLTSVIQDDLRQVKADVILEIEAAKTAPKMIEKPKLLTAVNRPDTDPLTDPEIALDTDVLTAFPMIASWLSTGRKTATLEEIVEASNRSLKTVKNRVAKGIIKRSGRNPNLYRIDSVIPWLKEENKSVDTVKLPAVKVGDSAPHPAVSSVHEDREE